jgi:poly(glycerol-phosphate) alpha-glucosyltransferase
LIKAIYKNKAPAKTIPVIHNVHTGNDVFDGPVSTFYKSVLENVDAYSAIVTLTEHQQRDIQDRFGGKNFFTIPHSYFEVPEMKPYEQRDRFKVVYLARYDLGHKQQDMALKAFKLVVNAVPMAQLYLHGFGADKDKIANLVKEMGLEANVHVNDFVADISLAYKDASLSILTSRVEAFCLSVMESLFHGCPVVSFDMKYGPASMIVNGENGFLIPPNDIELLASKIIDILTNDELHKKIVKNAQTSVSNLTHEAVGLMWRHLFDTLK